MRGDDIKLLFQSYIVLAVILQLYNLQTQIYMWITKTLGLELGFSIKVYILNKVISRN